MLIHHLVLSIGPSGRYCLDGSIRW